MGKSKNKKSKPAAEERSLEVAKENSEEAGKRVDDRDENRDDMDFGGLPQRDLKKNLGGCG